MKELSKQEIDELVASLEADLAPLARGQRTSVMRSVDARYRWLEGRLFMEVAEILTQFEESKEDLIG